MMGLRRAIPVLLLLARACAAAGPSSGDAGGAVVLERSLAADFAAARASLLGVDAGARFHQDAVARECKLKGLTRSAWAPPPARGAARLTGSRLTAAFVHPKVPQGDERQDERAVSRGTLQRDIHSKERENTCFHRHCDESNVKSLRLKLRSRVSAPPPTALRAKRRTRSTRS